MVDGLSAISNFAVTGRCNGRCTMCNIWKIDTPEDPPIEKIIHFFHKNHNFLKNLQFIQLTGGEPFLRNDLPEIADTVNDVAPECMIWIPTNGLLTEKIYDTTSRILELVNASRIGVTVSLDGEGEMHDIQRGIDGSYNKAIETLANLGALNEEYPFKLSTGFTLTAQNYKHAPIIQKISYHHGADFSFRPINLSEHYYQNTDNKIGFSPNDIYKTLDYIAYNFKREKGIRNGLTNLAYVQGAKEFISGERTMSCTAATNSVFINTQGDVFPCIVMNHKLGNIYENNLDEILMSPSTWAARETIEKMECPTCWLECETYRDITRNWKRLFDALLWGFILSS